MLRRMRGLFLQEGLEEGEKLIGDELRAFGGGMDAVVLNGVGHGIDVQIDIGDDGHVVLRGDEGEGLVEVAHVVGAVVGRERDAGEDDFAAGLEQRGDDGVEVATRVGDGQAAQTVVAAEFDKHDGGMQAEDFRQAIDAIFGGVAADAGVDDAVGVAAEIEVRLKIVGVRLAGIDAVSGGDAVAEAIDDGNGTVGNGGTRSGVCTGEEQEGRDESEGASHICEPQGPSSPFTSLRVLRMTVQVRR
jgi:hypothetical protein